MKHDEITHLARMQRLFKCQYLKAIAHKSLLKFVLVSCISATYSCMTLINLNPDALAWPILLMCARYKAQAINNSCNLATWLHKLLMLHVVLFVFKEDNKLLFNRITYSNSSSLTFQFPSQTYWRALLFNNQLILNTLMK